MSSNSKEPKPRKGPSSFVLERTRRFRLSWTRWSQTRLAKKKAKEERRLQLMLVQTDSQYLLLQEIDQRALLLQTRLSELLQSSEFRLTGVLPPPLNLSSELDQILGITKE